MRYFIILSFLIFSCTSDQIKESNIDSKAQDILSQMTLDEKVGQMAQINLTVIAKGPTKWSSSQEWWFI